MKITRTPKLKFGSKSIIVMNSAPKSPPRPRKQQTQTKTGTTHQNNLQGMNWYCDVEPSPGRYSNSCHLKESQNPPRHPQLLQGITPGRAEYGIQHEAWKNGVEQKKMNREPIESGASSYSNEPVILNSIYRCDHEMAYTVPAYLLHVVKSPLLLILIIMRVNQ